MTVFSIPIRVEQLCASLRAVRDQLPVDAGLAIDAALADLSQDALLLVFLEMSAPVALIFRTDGAYQFPAEHRLQPFAERDGSPRWLAYTARPEPRAQVNAPGSEDVKPRVADGLAGSLTQTLTRFHFFRCLNAVRPQIGAYDADVAAKLQQLEALRDGFAEDLDGHELNLTSAVAIALVEDGAAMLDLALDSDELHPDAQGLPAGHHQIPYEQNIVLLGRDLELDSCALIRLSRTA